MRTLKFFEDEDEDIRPYQNATFDRSVIIRVIDADTPSINGNIYSKEVLEDIVEQNKKQTILGGFSSAFETGKISLNHVSHAVKRMWIEDNSLMAEIKILNTPNGMLLSKLLKECIVSFSPVGHGNVDNGIVKNYKICGICAINEEPER